MKFKIYWYATQLTQWITLSLLHANYMKHWNTLLALLIFRMTDYWQMYICIAMLHTSSTMLLLKIFHLQKQKSVYQHNLFETISLCNWGKLLYNNFFKAMWFLFSFHQFKLWLDFLEYCAFDYNTNHFSLI